MSGENILVIAVDGLRAAALGAYGNTSFATPALDALAAGSFLVDACFAESVQLPAIYHAFWRSQGTSLPKLMRQGGYTTSLVTDDSTVAALDDASAFDDLVQLDDTQPARADSIAETSLAAAFAAAGDEIERAVAGRFVWLHTRGMYGPWDAPLALQEPMLERDEGDPPPDDVLEPPNLVLDHSHDPDTVFRWSCAYAAQVIALDACLGALRDAVAQSPRAWHVVFFGVRGFPLGEHSRVGGVDDRLYAEQLHVPFLWRFPDGTGRLARSSRLATHRDLLPTVLDLDSVNGGDGRNPPPDGVDLVPLARQSMPLPRDLISSSQSAQAIRTAEWTLRADLHQPAEPRYELFVRPDDRWEANDVAIRCPDVVDELARRLAELSLRASTASLGKSS